MEQLSKRGPGDYESATRSQDGVETGNDLACTCSMDGRGKCAKVSHIHGVTLIRPSYVDEEKKGQNEAPPMGQLLCWPAVIPFPSYPSAPDRHDHVSQEAGPCLAEVGVR